MQLLISSHGNLLNLGRLRNSTDRVAGLLQILVVARSFWLTHWAIW